MTLPHRLLGIAGIVLMSPLALLWYVLAALRYKRGA